MMEKPKATNRRRRDLTTRHFKWVLLLIIVGCLYLTAIPSASKYKGVLVDDEHNGQNATATHNNWRSQSMGTYNLSVSGDVKVVNAPSESGESPLKYSNGMNNHTINNVATLGDRSDEPSSKDDIQEISASTIDPPPLEYNDTFAGQTSRDTTIISSQIQSSLASNKTPANTEAVDNASTVIPPPMVYNNNTLHNVKSPPTASPYNYSTDIDLVSLTVRDDFFVLFNNSAITSWLTHIQNIRSITFIGPSKDYGLFLRNMHHHYPHLLSNIHNNNNNTNSNSNSNSVPPIPIRWTNETHWKTTYQNKYQCPYRAACQQLIKLHVFDLRTHLGLEYMGNNVLIVDSDTVWSRNTTFVHDDGRVQYFDVRGTYKSQFDHDAPDGDEYCTGMDPVKFTEAITAGSSLLGPRGPTASPYRSCRRPEYPDATGARHIAHHMLFQYDVMMHLHALVRRRWDVSTLWAAFGKCHGHDFCKSRIAEYELYYAFVSAQYPERVRLESLVNGEDYMSSSAICNEEEMECCRERGVLLKGCHDHRIRLWERDASAVGDMCCTDKIT